jgi:hypothetical protein
MSNTSDIAECAAWHAKAIASAELGDQAQALVNLEGAAAIVDSSPAFQKARGWCKRWAGRRLWPSIEVGLYAVSMALHAASVKLDLDQMRDAGLYNRGAEPVIAAIDDLCARHSALLGMAVPTGFGDVHALTLRATQAWPAERDRLVSGIGTPDGGMRIGLLSNETANTLLKAGLDYMSVAKAQMGLDALTIRKRRPRSRGS